MDWNWYSCPSCGAEWRGPLNWKQDDKNVGQHELDCPDRLAAQARLAALVVGDISYEAERAAVDDGHWADLDWLATAEAELKRIRRNAARRASYAERKATR